MNPPNPAPTTARGVPAPVVVLAMVLFAVVAMTPPARAGQVRVDATSNSVFIDSTAAVNPGDQVVWVSTGGIHTAISGTVNSGSGVPDGKFTSPNFGSSTNGCFAWKSAGSGNIWYYCLQHLTNNMWGRIRILSTGVPVSDFRITEVRWTAAHDHDFVEIANLGDATGNLGRYRLSLRGTSPLTFALRDLVVPSGGRVVVNLGISGSDNASQLYFPAATLGPGGSAALYCATTAAADTTITNDKLIIDYVQWGAGGYRNETTAATAGLWTTGDLAPAVADGHSIEFCGTRADRGMGFWQGSPTPTPGTINCVTPVISSSWGRIKTLYR